MWIITALVAVAFMLLLAKRGIGHPGDYLVAGGLAIQLALSIWLATPNAVQDHMLVERHAPAPARALSHYLFERADWIVAALVIFTAATAAASWMRRPHDLEIPQRG